MRSVHIVVLFALACGSAPVAVCEGTTCACERDEDCALTGYVHFVGSAADCYCPLLACAAGAPGLPIRSDAAAANQASWSASCAGMEQALCASVTPCDFPRASEARCDDHRCAKFDVH